ncbi:MAG: phosphate ABC transporter permease subunit PstC [Bacillota bacterium]
MKYNLESNLSDRVFHRITKGFAWSILILVFVMVAVMVGVSWPAIKKFGLEFLVSTEWNPVSETFGALPFIYGSVVTSIIALLIAVPLGVGSAVFLSELAPKWLRDPLSFVIELLAAVPSVIYGLWGLFALAPVLRNYIQPFLKEKLGFLPFFEGPALGVGLMAAGIILAIMILPIITSITRDVLETVPEEQREGVLALGATKWESIWHVVLPYGKAGIIGAIILALGRAIGETMAVTMLIGNANKISSSFFGLGNTMASGIANEFAEASSDIHTGALLGLGLVLFIITLILNIAARFMINYLSFEKD